MNNNSSGLWTVLIIAFVLGVMLVGMFSDNNSSSTSTSTSTPAATGRGSFEHRYATERFKQEGFSASEAQQAADAVIKFHNAQKGR